MVEFSLLELGHLFVVVAVAGVVGRRLGLSVIPLYVVGGMLASPFVAGQFGLPYVQGSETLTLLAEVGIVLLLFFLGLEFSLDRLLAAKTNITRAGLIDILINLPVGVVIGLGLGWSLVEALLLGGIVYISSSAIITKSLIDLGWIANAESEPILGTLVFEDLFIAVYLALVTSLVLGASGDGGGGLEGVALSVAIAFGFLGALLLCVQYGTRFFSGVLDVEAPEPFVLRTLGVLVPVAGFALSIGVSEAVAAFFVGMGFSTTEHRERIERRLLGIRDVFAAVFFFWIGVNTDPRLVAAVAVPLVLVVLVTAPTKIISGYYSGRVYRLTPRRSFRVGVGMVSRGEFSLVIAALAAGGAGRVMTEVIPAFAVGYVLVMSTLGTVLMGESDRLERLVFRGEAETATAE